MGIFSSGTKPERRDAFAYPAIPPNSQNVGVSARHVDLSKAHSALAHVAVHAATNLLATEAEILPIDCFSGSVKNKIPMPRWLGDLTGTGAGLSDYLYMLVQSWALTGNSISNVVDRDSTTGKPRTLDMIHPDDVRIQKNWATGEQTWYVKGKEVPRSQLYHSRVYPIPGNTMGLSPIGMHAVTVGTGLSALNFGAQWFLDGAHPSSVLTNESLPELDQAPAAAIKARFMQAVRGTREPVVLAGGWKYQQIQIAPAESQFLETQEFSAAEAARIYGPGMPEILGYKVGSPMTYANIEQRMVSLLMLTIDPWLVRAERHISNLLPEPQFVKFDRKALLRTDTKTRFEGYQLALKNAWRTINEIREEEGLAPVEWGDEPYALAPSTPDMETPQEDQMEPQPTMAPIGAPT